MAICSICGVGGDELELFPLASGRRRQIELHRRCAQAHGFWCFEHDQAHVGLFEELHYCPSCYRETLTLLRSKKREYFVRLIKASLPLEQYKLLQQWLRLSPLARPQQSFVEPVFDQLFQRALVRSGSPKLVAAEIDSIIEMIKRDKTFVGHLIPPTFALLAEQMGGAIETLLVPLKLISGCDCSRN